MFNFKYKNLEADIKLLEGAVWTLKRDMEIRKTENENLQRELRNCMKFIGALFEYLEVRPQRTFIEDFSKLPEEEHPTMEVIKVVKKSTKKTPSKVQ